MNIYRSYFSKNNTIVKDSELNSAKNQVTEIAYGGENNIFSCFLFKIDIDQIKGEINEKEYSIDQLNQPNTHILNLKNTINLSTTINTNLIQERASSFELVLFKLDQEWDEGNGYNINLTKSVTNKNKITSPSNWYNSKNNETWNPSGSFDIFNYEIIDTISFDNGDEDFVADITDYINEIIFSGTPNYGLGIAFNPTKYYDIKTDYIQSVNFHTKYTNTYFEPYLETNFNNHILDDRNCFYLDSDNRLYFFAKRGKNFYNIDMKYVNIYDNNNELILKYNIDKINKNRKGVYYIDINLDSDTYIDSTLFKDEWVFEKDGIQKSIINSFYIVDYSSLEENFNNLISIKIFGIYNNQIVKRGDDLNIDITFRSLYDNLINYCSYDFTYDLYVKYGRNNIYLIKDGLINKVPNKYFLNIDTNFLIENTYYLDINVKQNNQNINNTKINFKIV